MNKFLFKAAGAAGLLAIAWVAAGYLRSNPLALLMTLLIGAFYAMGVLELHRFAQSTSALNKALADLATPPTDAAALAQWLARTPPTLQAAVGLRIQGDRAALPGPALAPFLAGLLVLLGMLGTFVGMVITLNGTGVALEQATNVQTMRDSLAAPVRGLGLAFGTSVAGIAGSAMLGLMSALCRHERQQAGQWLDSHTATTLQGFSRASQQEQRRQAEKAAAQQQALAQQEQLLQHQTALRREEQQQQQQALAQQQELQQRLHNQALRQQQDQHQQLLKAQQEWHEQALQHQQQHADQHAQLQAQLLAQQTQFHSQAQEAYRALVTSVEASLQNSISESTSKTSTLLHTAVQATLHGINRETAALQSHASSALQQQLQGFAQRFEAQSGTWLQSLGEQAQHQQTQLVQALGAALSEQQAQHQIRDEQRLAAWGTALAALAATVEQSASRTTAQTEQHAANTMAEMARLVHNATEAPREAAQVVAQMVAQLRDKLSDSLARDNAMLEERSRIMTTLNTVLAAAQHTATEQKAAIDQMVATTNTWLQQAGARFTEQAQADAERLQAVSAQLTSSAVDVASLGEAFGAAVDQFSLGSGQLLAHLQSLEAALERSTTRSDEQLAYYVAQAREVIDLSLLSQKQIVDDLQRLGSRAQTTAAAEALT